MKVSIMNLGVYEISSSSQGDATISVKLVLVQVKVIVQVVMMILFLKMVSAKKEAIGTLFLNFSSIRRTSLG
jgi:hypothetical protein